MIFHGIRTISIAKFAFSMEISTLIASPTCVQVTGKRIGKRNGTIGYLTMDNLRMV